MNTPLHEELARAGLPGLAQLVSDLRDGQLDLKASLEQLLAENATQNAAIARLVSGFPADDIDGHRRYHESVIEARELRNKLIRATVERALSSGVLVGLGWVMVAIWQYFQLEVRR